MRLFNWIDKKKTPKELLPIPTHLQSILFPLGDKNSECEVTGIIKCHCRNDFLDREIPLEKVCCSKCGQSNFRITLHISSQGKEDFAEECLANGDSFSQEDWVNAFDWITISLSCIKCRHSEKSWLDFEAM